MASNSAFSEKSKESSRLSKMLPPVLLSHKVQTLISSVKEIQLITTYEEVLDGLGQYIAKKNLFDPKNQKVCCKGDDLGSVLGTEEFLMSDLNTILPKLAVPVSKIPSCSAGSAALLSDNPLKRKLDGGFDYDQRKIPAMHSTSPMIVHIPPSPIHCDLSDSVESIQGYETAYVKDTSDEFLSAENGEEQILAIEETFDIEYEVETDSSNSTLSEDSSDSDSEELVDHIEEAIVKFLTEVVYKPKPDSDIEFFADASSDDDEQSDAEIGESDFWSCPKCNIKNRPTVRYCLKCFQQRRNWLADKPSNMKRKNRKSRGGFNGIKDKSSEASSSKCQLQSQENIRSSGVSCEIKENSSNPSSPKTESAGSCKSDLGDSSSIESKDSNYIQSQDTLAINDIESLDLINGESSSMLCMNYLDSSRTKSLSSPSMKTNGSSSMKPTISSNWDSSGPSSMESSGTSSMKPTVSSNWDSSGPSSMESSGPSSMKPTVSSNWDSSGPSSMESSGPSSMKPTVSSNWDSSGPSSMESSGPSSMESGIYSIESSGPSSMELSCPSSMECSESSHMEKYDSEKLCIVCCSEPVNASIIHGKFAHQISCYKCARKLQKGKKDCPICRRAIDRVVIQVTM